VGSLMYLVNTRPYMFYSVNQLSQAMVRPTRLYWKVIKHVFQYLKGTTQYRLWYRKAGGVKIQGFTDVDCTGSPFDRKSTLGGIFSIGSVTIFGYNKKQRSIALNLKDPLKQSCYVSLIIFLFSIIFFIDALFLLFRE